MSKLSSKDERISYDNGAFTPTPIPVPRNVADPVALTPNPRSDRNLRIQLHAHLKIALKDRFGYWE